MTSLRKMYTKEMLLANTSLENLRKTEAGQKALELDKADGKYDGKISASVWNEYAKGYGGNEIQNEIDVVDAMNSITTYSVRAEARERQADIERTQQEALEDFSEHNNEKKIDFGLE